MLPGSGTSRAGSEIVSSMLPIYAITARTEESYPSGGNMRRVHLQILEKNGEKQFAVLPYEEFLALQERLADAEDVLELRKAKRAEGKKKSIPLADAKRKLGLR